MILYLHGFRSSPQSFKAQLLAQHFHSIGLSGEYCCPQLPASPKQAIQIALACVQSVSPDALTIVGSSLGGYYATWLAEQIGCAAVLLNPAVNPVRDLKGQIGVTTYFHSEAVFEFTEQDFLELSVLSIERITRPERYFLMVTTGDEVLDWIEMTAYYAGARQHVIEGSDHGIHNFSDYIDEVLEFCNA